MKLVAFRIQNFRSIVDTNWCPLSSDQVTVFVGQNESGKTSVLQALHCLLDNDPVSADDVRAASPLPVMHARCEFELFDFDDLQSKLCMQQATALSVYVRERRSRLDFVCNWTKDAEGYSLQESMHDADLEAVLADAWLAFERAHAESEAQTEGATLAGDGVAPAVSGQSAASTPSVTSKASRSESKPEEFDLDDLANYMYARLPSSTLFNADSGLPPSTVDINDRYQPTGPNASAAVNFLTIAEIDLKSLLEADRREREFILTKANKQISADFNSFWTQTIGKANHLSIRCEIENYGAEKAEKAGKPHLVFWIGDGNNQLYPKQRSQGVRWFISFYLQMKATEKLGGSRLFLMDEPGSNLHPKAQKDVLRLINQLSKAIQIIYSTHSSSLLEYDKLYRVHAVQRAGDKEESPTEIIDAHRLGAASLDTLSPLLLAMGIDLSSQEVVKKSNNVLLEEISGFYYLNAFWKLTGEARVAHFVAASGVSNVPMLANCFLGWGLQFIAVVDDDSHGRSVYNELKRNLFGDDEEKAKARLWKIKGCTGIEDVFSQADFLKYVLRDPAAKLTGTNAEFVKKAGRPKAVLAYQIWADVQAGTLKKASFDAETQTKIDAVVAEISGRLENLPQA